MQSFALKSMLRRKKSYVPLLVVSILSFALITGMVLFQSSMQEMELKQRQSVFGSWKAAVKVNSEDVVKNFSTHPMIENISVCINRADFEMDGECCGKIGSVNKNVLKKDTLKLMDGQFPQRENEVVVEMSVLTKMGYSFEVGQELPLKLRYKDAITREWKEVDKTFLISGVLRDYSTYWKKEGFDYPSIIARDQDLPQETKEQIVLLETKEDIKKLEQDFENIAGHKLILNDYTYPEIKNKMFSYNTLFLFLILAILTTFFIFELYHSVWEKRRKSLQILRKIGAEKRQIYSLLCWEAVYIGAVGLIVGNIFGISGSYGLTVLLERKINMPLEFHIPFVYLFMGNIIVILAIWLGVFLTSIRTKNRREHRFLKVTGYWFGVVLIFVFVSVMGDRWREYQTLGEEDYRTSILPWYEEKPQYQEEYIEQMKMVNGMDHVDTLRITGYLPISWKGMEESIYAQKLSEAMRRFYPEEGTFASVIGIQKDEKVFEAYRECIVEGKLDEEAFWAGKEVMVYLPTLYLKQDGSIIMEAERQYCEYKESYEENSLEVGDTLIIEGAQGKKKVQVGGIIKDYGNATQLEIASDQRYGVIAADKFFDQLMEADTERTYSFILGYAGEQASYETTDREMAIISQNVAERNPSSPVIINLRIEKEQSMKRIVSGLVIYGTLFALLILSFAFLQWNSVLVKAESVRKKIGILRALGMTKRQLQLQYMKNTAKGIAISILVVIPVGVLIKSLFYLRELMTADWGVPWIMPQNVSGFLREIMSPVCKQIPWHILCVLLVGYMIFLTYILYVPYGRVIRENIVVNLKDE